MSALILGDQHVKHFTGVKCVTLISNFPPIEIQQKYVDIFNDKLANQWDYENGLEDLKLACFTMADHFNHIKRRILVGELLEEFDVRNSEGIVIKESILQNSLCPPWQSVQTC